MKEKEILKRWQNLNDLYEIELNNLEVFIETEIKDNKTNHIEDKLKYVKETKQRLTTLKNEANKALNEYYTVRFKDLIHSNINEESSKSL